MPASNAIPKPLQLLAHLPRTHVRSIGVDSIHLSHEFEIDFRHGRWNVVERPTGEAENLGLAR